MIADFFTYKGRLNRKPYWIKTLIVLVVLFVGVGIGSTMVFSGMMIPGLIVGAIIAIPAIIASIMIALRRLHDRNKSWWWLLLYYVVPNGLQGLGETMGATGLGSIPMIISFGISIWALVDLGFLKGTDGPNDYGPDPLTGVSAEPDVFS